MRKIRRIAYWLGYRPRKGSIFYSPTLSYTYAWRDYDDELGWERLHGRTQR